MHARLLLFCTALVLQIGTGNASAYIIDSPPALRIAECQNQDFIYHVCARAIERHELSKAGRPFASRQGDLLQISLAGGKVLLKDDGPEHIEGRSYSYVGFSRPLNFHIIHIQYYEGEGYLLIHHQSGQRAEISGYPLAAPDNQRFVALSEDLEAGYNPNNIEIWKIRNGRFYKETSFEPEWGPRRAKWISSGEIQVTKNCWGPDGGSLDACGVAAITLRNKKWALQE